MTQYSFGSETITNLSFPATRTALNAAIQALASNSSGDADPSVAGTTVANQWWYETDTNILKIRNEANNGWVDVITLDASMTASASELNQLDAITRGSILYGNASGATARLAKGAAGTVLTSDGTDISWAAAGGDGYTGKAWVNFNGTGTLTIRGNGNVSSVTDNSVGNYTVNFTVAMSDGNYADTWGDTSGVSGKSMPFFLTAEYGSYKTSSSLRFKTYTVTGALQDSINLSLLVIA